VSGISAEVIEKFGDEIIAVIGAVASTEIIDAILECVGCFPVNYHAVVWRNCWLDQHLNVSRSSQLIHSTIDFPIVIVPMSPMMPCSNGMFATR
jgi:hypothetical protein